MWIAPLSLSLSFGAFISLFIFFISFSWDFFWHISVGAFPLWARQCEAWYSCQCFWCTPCNHWSWDSITLSASWGNIFTAPQILTWYAAVSGCKDLTRLCMEWESLCVHVVMSNTLPGMSWRLVQMLWFSWTNQTLFFFFFWQTEACPCVHRCSFFSYS